MAKRIDEMIEELAGRVAESALKRLAPGVDPEERLGVALEMLSIARNAQCQFPDRQDRHPVEWIAFCAAGLGDMANTIGTEDIDYDAYRCELLGLGAAVICAVESLDKGDWTRADFPSPPVGGPKWRPKNGEISTDAPFCGECGELIEDGASVCQSKDGTLFHSRCCRINQDET